MKIVFRPHTANSLTANHVISNRNGFIFLIEEVMLFLSFTDLKTWPSVPPSSPIDHFTVVAKLPGLRIEVRLSVTLLSYKPLCFSNVNVD